MCQLPSGRRISYYDPVIKSEETQWGIKDGLTYMAVDPKSKQWIRERTYGGKLAENITQGVASCVLRDAMVRVEDKGYSIIMTVHDETISEDFKDFGSLKEFEKLMEVPPRWALGLPIKVGTYESVRYKK